MLTGGTPTRFIIHSLATIVEGLGSMCLSTFLRALHQSVNVIESLQCEQLQDLGTVGELRMSSNSFVVQRNTPFSQVIFHFF